MTRLVVQAGFGATATTASVSWTDITRYVDLVDGIQITRGAQDELSDVQPATCRLTLNNTDGQFTPGNASSPYSPNVRKNTPIRVRVVSASKNLITNPSFESGLTDWFKSASPSYATSTTQARNGSQSMLLSFASNGATGQNAYTYCWGLDIGQTYTFSAYVYVPTGDTPVALRVDTPDGNTQVAATPNSTVFDAWQRLTLTFTATDTTHMFRVIAPGTPASGDQVWIDAVQVEDGPTATGFNLLSNSSFETDTTGWTSSGGPTLARSSDRAWDGAASMLVTWDGSASPYAATTVSNLVAGATYTASAYVWVPPGGAPVLLRAAGVVSGSASTVTGAWQRISVTWTQPSGSTTRQVNVQPATTAAAGQQVWVDAVQVEDGSTATSFGPNDGAQVYDRFWGMVNEWPMHWEGLQSTTTITATDLFKWLGMQRQLRPMLVEEMLQDKPRAYYPMSEGTDSTTLGDLSGYSTGALSVYQAGSGGTIDFGAGGGPADSLGCPKFTPTDASNGKYLRASLGTRFTDAANTYGNLFLEFWFATTTGARTVLSLASADGNSQLMFKVNSSGALAAYYSTEGAALGSYPSNFGSGYADGAVHHVVVDVHATRVYIDGVDQGTGSNIHQPDDPARLWIGASPDYMSIPGTGTLWSGTIAQVAIYVGGSTTAADLTAHYNVGHGEMIGETADNRAKRIAGYIGMAVTTSGSRFDGLGSQKALGKTALEHLRDITSTESGRLFIDRATGQLTLQSRDVRYNPPSALTVDYADLETGDVDLADDDAKMVNTVEATRPGGAVQRVVNTTARDRYGPYEQQIDIFKDADTKVLDATNWLVSRYADPPPELRHVPLEIYSLPLATYRAALSVDVSSMITVNNLPSQAPTSTATVFVEGYTETIGQNQHVIDWYTSRAGTDTVWVLGDSSYSVLDTSTRLAY